MRRCYPALLLCLLSACQGGDAAPRAPGPGERTFYVRPGGHDTSTGESPDDAWQTLSRVNDTDLDPGDRVLLEAGARFAGTLRLDADDSGTAERPIRIGSFGDGRATLAAGSGNGIELDDASGIELAQLTIAGDWDAAQQRGNDGEGVSATGRRSGERRRHLRLHDLEVSGFKRAGIALHAEPGDDAKQSGFEDVEISRCSVHDNGDVGLTSDGPFSSAPGYSHADVRVRYVRAYANRGLQGKGSHTGSGIVLSDVEGALIERCVASDNGEYNDAAQGGGYGIWAWDARDVTIQYNESHHNRSASVDGGGFDLDGGVTRSAVQFNFSHDNAGAGYGAFQFGGARAFDANLIQYNISQNDGFGFLLWDGNGDMGSITIAHNTAYGEGPILQTYSPLTAATLANNILYGVGSSLLEIDDARGLTLDGNAYWSGEAAFRIVWQAGRSFDSLEAFRDATQKEASGLQADPQLSAAGTAGTLDDPDQLDSLTMYQLDDDSPLIDRSVEPGAALADHDFFGDPAPLGAARDSGAHERR